MRCPIKLHELFTCDKIKTAVATFIKAATAVYVLKGLNKMSLSKAIMSSDSKNFRKYNRKEVPKKQTNTW